MIIVRCICAGLKHINYERTTVNSAACAFADPAGWVVWLRLAHGSASDEHKLGARKQNDNSEKTARRKVHSDPSLCDQQQAFCDATDAQVLQLLKALRLTEAVALTVRSFADRRFPSSKTVTTLIAALARKGDVGGLKTTREMVDSQYPVVSAEQIRFEHYHAEALSRAGQATEAILKFEQLFASHKSHRVKICSLLAFLAAYLAENNMVDEVAELAAMCRRLADRGYFHPLSNVWRVLFLSEKRRYHANAWELVEAVRLRPSAKPFFEKKVASVISRALESCDVDMVQRLLNVVLYLGMQESCGLVLSFLLEFYCDAEDVKSAQKAYEHSKTYGIELNPVTLYRYTCFLSSQGIQVPYELLLKKYNMDSRKSADAAKHSKVKFKF
ncbi:hypothetical protein V5799_031270 [Amblyomma americanum]|uniref:Uncharacterized protein n=1 Tax=Amblyomma americanum TaxID=6943 RepID=A0AAQ4ELC1_AMBAM